MLVGYTQSDTYSDWAGVQFTNTTTKEIVRDGDKIIYEKITEYNQLENTTSVKNVKYMYDEKGASGMTVNNVSYYFVRNIFGDVTAIYDESRNKKAEYSYDAWGTCYMPVNVDGIGSLNPFRYRGYYFVPQIGLYYLTTRFYDYMTGRFVNADVPSVCLYNGFEIPEGSNLYSYCLNNPIIYKKRSATFAGSNATTTNSISYTFSMGGLGTGNNSAPEWLQTVVGAIPDIMLCMRYLTAKGMHGKFAYSTSTRYIHPVMGGTWRWFGKSRSSRVNIGNVAQGTFRQLLTGDARAGIGSIAKSAGKAIGLIALVNFGFNLYENNWQIDSAMLKDTAIDTAIGVGAYYLAVGTMSLVTAGLVTAGIALPGIIVVGGVFLLSIGFEYIIRAIFGYWD